MAEKADWPYAVCLTLTYADLTQTARDGAAMFCYADVSDFLKRLRSAARYEARKGKWNFTPVVRFLCAGEQGSRHGRCHWHLIIYSNFDLCRLGKFRLRGHLVSHRRDMVTEGKRKRRLNWTLWPHGFMTLQEPDQAGMNYVLSYCLKDQFSGEKSSGTMREASSENFATGLFRMSKYPPIGENFLMRKMESLLEKGAVLPALQIRVPGFSGYWQPSGSFRKKLLWCLVALNKRILWTTGAPAPQWSSLLSSLSQNDADLEILNGPQQNEQDEQTLEAAVAFRGREVAEARRLGEIRRNCGRRIPCLSCLNGSTEGQIRDFGLVRTEAEDGSWVYASSDGLPGTYKELCRPLGRSNPACKRLGTADLRKAFPRTGVEGP